MRKSVQNGVRNDIANNTLYSLDDTIHEIRPAFISWSWIVSHDYKLHLFD